MKPFFWLNSKVCRLPKHSIKHVLNIAYTYLNNSFKKKHHFSSLKITQIFLVYLSKNKTKEKRRLAGKSPNKKASTRSSPKGNLAAQAENHLKSPLSPFQKRNDG